MKKREQKSLSSLVEDKKIDDAAIEKATGKIHRAKNPEKEKLIKVSVATPKSLYIKCKMTALDEEIPSLKDFYLHCIEEYFKRRDG